MSYPTPSYLYNLNPHPRDTHITFDEGPHIYTVDGDSNYTSVTTIVHQHFGKFDSDKVIQNIKNGKKWNENNKYWGMTDEEIKELWKENGRVSAEKGTIMHYNIECFYNNDTSRLDNDDSLEKQYFMNFYNDHKHMKPYRTEWTVWDKELKVSGSIDMVFENEDGTLSIYDWKRTKAIKKLSFKNVCSNTPCLEHIPDCNFWHYSMQLNIYKYMLEKNYNKTIKDIYLVKIHPNNHNQNYIKIKCADMQNEIKDIMNLRLNN